MSAEYPADPVRPLASYSATVQTACRQTSFMISRQLTLCSAVIIFMGFAPEAMPEPELTEADTTVDALKRSRITGALGVPPGNAVEVLVEVIDGESHGEKDWRETISSK